MAPEQVTDRFVDFRADQFALGTLIYEMITGQRAFKRDTSVLTMAAIVEAEPEPIAGLIPDASAELVTIVERCLAKDPADRYASTQDLARDLREVRAFAGSRTSRSGFALTPAPRRRCGACGCGCRDPRVAIRSLALQAESDLRPVSRRAGDDQLRTRPLRWRPGRGAEGGFSRFQAQPCLARARPRESQTRPAGKKRRKTSGQR